MLNAQVRAFIRVLGLLGLCGIHVLGSEAAERVTLQLKWTHSFQFAGYYAAIEKGFYRDAGLDVQLREAAPGEDPVNAVLTGRAQYGVSTSSLLLARADGKPVVALGVIYQHSPYVLLARSDAGIRDVRDLRGRRVSIEPQADELVAYLTREGLPRGSYQNVPHSQRVEDLVRGWIDAQSAYLPNEPGELERKGVSYLTFSPRTLGIDFYGDNLFTTEAELKRKPERVRAFREASLRGWAYALAHPEELIELIVRRYPRGLDREHLAFEARRMETLIRPDVIEIGYMNPARWRHIADVYGELGMLRGKVSLEGFLYDPRPGSRFPWGPFVLVLGAGLGVLGIALHYRRLTQKLQASEQRHRLLADHVDDVIWILDLEGRITYISPSISRLTGFRDQEVLGKPVVELLAPISARLVRERLRQAQQEVAEGRRLPHFRMELEHRTKDDGTVWAEVRTSAQLDEVGRTVGITGVSRDITERRAFQAELEFQASTDLLTGAWNRGRTEEMGRNEVQRYIRYGHAFALVFLDLDHFKRINDDHGHAAGDVVLRGFCEVVKGCLRATDVLGRWGGEEFLVLTPNTALANARLLAERIRTATELRHFEGVGQVTASLGVAECRPGDSWESLVARADAALYRAKSGGRNRVEADPSKPHAVPKTFLRLVWSSGYASGNLIIDAQHEDLFVKANALIDRILGEGEAVDVEARFQELVDHVQHHFDTELGILERAGYGSLEHHAELHRDLLTRARTAMIQYRRGDLQPGPLLAFLAYDVVAQHMLQDDMDFFPLFQTAGG